MQRTMTISEFIDGLKARRDLIPFIPDMEADDLRVSTEDILPITPAVYQFRLDLLPPKWLDRQAFAYGEAGNQLHLFWQEGPSEYYVLCMADSETDEFYDLIGRSRY